MALSSEVSPALVRRLEPLLAAAPGASAVAAVAIVGQHHGLVHDGHRDAHFDVPISAHTRFEIGSLTKTFTSLLLSDMVTRGQVGLDEPINRYLPVQARPRRDIGEQITLQQLATHTAGLPKLPANFFPVALPRWNTNPYADYTHQHLWRATRHSRPRRASKVRYSNFGFGLLGQLLANATTNTYEHLLATHVCTPLCLDDTSTAASPDDLTGYHRGRPVPHWAMPGLVAAGALRSSAHDLLHYLSAWLHPHATPLTEALQHAQRPRPNPAPGGPLLTLSWKLRRYSDHDLYFHGGATRGFTAFAGFCPQKRTALGALVNEAPTLRASIVQPAYDLLKALIATTN